MPRVGVPRLSSTAPPSEGIICAYPYWSALIVKVNHLPERLGGGLSTHGNVRVSVGIKLI
jgi:hypothetical protein